LDQTFLPSFTAAMAVGFQCKDNFGGAIDFLLNANGILALLYQPIEPIWYLCGRNI
jgi:hypothetical protein